MAIRIIQDARLKRSIVHALMKKEMIPPRNLISNEMGSSVPDASLEALSDGGDVGGKERGHESRREFLISSTETPMILWCGPDNHWSKNIALRDSCVTALQANLHIRRCDRSQ